MPFLHAIRGRHAFVMLSGISGSGKSTVVARIRAVHPDAVVLSGDDKLFARAKAEGIGYGEAFARHYREVVEEVVADARAAFAAGALVVWDQTNLTPAVRAPRLELAPKGYMKLAIACEVERRTQDRRLDARGETEEKPIPAEQLEAQRTLYVRPALSEGFDRVFVVKSGEALPVEAA